MINIQYVLKKINKLLCKKDIRKFETFFCLITLLIIKKINKSEFDIKKAEFFFMEVDDIVDNFIEKNSKEKFFFSNEFIELLYEMNLIHDLNNEFGPNCFIIKDSIEKILAIKMKN